MCVYVRACCRPRLVCHLAAGIKNNNRKQTMPSSRHLRLSAQQAVRGGSRERVSRREGKRGREEEKESGSVFLLTNYLNTLRLLLYGNGSVLQRILTATPTAHTPHTHPSHTHTCKHCCIGTHSRSGGNFLLQS